MLNEDTLTWRLMVFVSLWLILNFVLLATGGYAFVFMFEEASFYGKGSTGVLLIIAFGLYKVHTKYFKYVAELKRRITNKEVV